MLFTNILNFSSKMFCCFNETLYIRISSLKCEECSLNNLKQSYSFFATQEQLFTKLKIQNFQEYPIVDDVKIDISLELKSICLVNGNNLETIKEWQGSNSKELISFYLEEIKNAIVSNLTKDGDKIQIKIKIDGKVKEFVFWEFTISAGYVEFSNCRFSTQKDCFLDYFPKEVYSMNYPLHYRNFYVLMIVWPLEQYEAKNITERENIKSSSVKIEDCPINLFYDMKNFKKLNEFKFSDFNLSFKQSEDFEKSIKTLEAEGSISKPITLFFEVTKKIPKISFDLFVPVIVYESKQIKIKSKKSSLEISTDQKKIRKIEEIFSFSLVDIQKEENSLKVVLGRPSVDEKNPLKAKDSLSIEFLDSSTNIKSTKITLSAKEQIEGDFTFTTFTIQKNEKKGRISNLYHAMTKYGLVSITLNGESKRIGTYGFFINDSAIYNCIYSDKLISIPLEAKPGFFTTNVIIVVIIVGLLICIAIFAYFYIKKKCKHFLIHLKLKNK